MTGIMPLPPKAINVPALTQRYSGVANFLEIQI
jgi:hypothetical protein